LGIKCATIPIDQTWFRASRTGLPCRKIIFPSTNQPYLFHVCIINCISSRFNMVRHRFFRKRNVFCPRRSLMFWQNKAVYPSKGYSLLRLPLFNIRF
jgi:hypothetical protein